MYERVNFSHGGSAHMLIEAGKDQKLFDGNIVSEEEDNIIR